MVCKSKGGLGKTFTTINFLEEQKIDYEYNSGVTTAVALYKMLYDFKDKIIVLDDIETLFQDDRAITLLKSALWSVNKKRIVSYKTSSKALEGYPESFEFNGQLIILVNELRAKNDQSTQALLSRCLVFELKYSTKEMKILSEEIIEQQKDLTTKQKDLTKKIIEESITKEHDYNFRILDRLITFVKHDENIAKELFINSMPRDETITAFYETQHDNIKKHIEDFIDLTGTSRATFYRIKKRIEND